MADPKPTPGKNALEQMFDQPITRPDNDEGIGPTLGEDVGARRQREEDVRNGARDADRSEEA